MRVVIDGDSVAEHRADNWPSFLSQFRPTFNIVNLSEHRSTTLDVIARISKALWDPTDLYILQLGQWSSRNQDLNSFHEDIGYIVRQVHACGVPVCLSTPASMDPLVVCYVETVCELAAIHNTMLVDCYGLARSHGMDRSWFTDLGDQIPCHLNEKGAAIVARFFVDSVKHPYGSVL